ncbi:MAG: hypothetical protein ACRC8A_19900 [Microcoleaceae cyanobacterium]
MYEDSDNFTIAEAAEMTGYSPKSLTRNDSGGILNRVASVNPNIFTPDGYITREGVNLIANYKDALAAGRTYDEWRSEFMAEIAPIVPVQVMPENDQVTPSVVNFQNEIAKWAEQTAEHYERLGENLAHKVYVESFSAGFNRGKSRLVDVFKQSK